MQGRTFRGKIEALNLETENTSKELQVWNWAQSVRVRIAFKDVFESSVDVLDINLANCYEHGHADTTQGAKSGGRHKSQDLRKQEAAAPLTML